MSKTILAGTYLTRGLEINASIQFSLIHLTDQLKERVNNAVSCLKSIQGHRIEILYNGVDFIIEDDEDLEGGSEVCSIQDFLKRSHKLELRTLVVENDYFSFTATEHGSDIDALISTVRIPVSLLDMDGDISLYPGFIKGLMGDVGSGEFTKDMLEEFIS